VTEIIANDVQFLEPRGATAGAGAPARSAAATHDEIPAPDDAPRDVDPDDIPF
jgi:single-stranded DNA-binding protein